MGWFTRKAEDRPVGIAWSLGADDTLTYKADFRMEVLDALWTSELQGAMSPSNRGFRTNTGRNPLPWASDVVNGVELDSHRRRALLTAFAPPGHEPQTNDGLPFRDIPGMQQLTWLGHGIGGFSVSPDGTRVAILEMRGGTDAVLAVVDITTGARVEVTSVQNAFGDETPQWSTDGNWILLNTHPALLVDLAGRRQMTFSATDNPYQTAVDWWPARGGSSIFMLHGSHGEFLVSEFDVSTGRRSIVSEVQHPIQPDLELARQSVTRPKVSPVDDTVLVGLRIGPPAEYQEQYGSRDRMALLDAGTGEVRQLFEPFIDGTPVEREHDHWRWNRVAINPKQVGLADSITEQLVACPTPPPFTNDGHQHVSLWLWTAA